MAGNFRVSIDTGGTFTDVLAVDESTGSVYVVKTPSDREDPSRALLAGIDKILSNAGKEYAEIETVIHGTTTATNAVLEHEFSGIGLLVTEGFRHILEIARQSVPDGYGNSFFWVKPPRLVPLHLVREVPERILFDGTVYRDIDLDAVIESVRELVAQGVNRVGVCLLHSYANPEHEQRIADVLANHFPDLFVSLSSVVLPEYREYERAMTTLVDAMVKPYCRDYLMRAGRQIGQRTDSVPFLIMQSNGGVVTAEAAADKPVTMLLSGPAGGVLGAIEAAKAAGFADLITLDVGGTSTDVALVDNLSIRLTSETVIENYPVKVPMIDLATVGTGGGSLAWVGPNNSLKVGPKSAGAVPGPICYGRGGTGPTVTDAAVVLGRFPSSLVGGDLNLDVAAARSAMEEFGRGFGLNVDDAAAGILEVATVGQVAGIRQVSTLKGRDPSGYCLVAFGGAGPLLATSVAEFLNIRSVLIPPNPGNLSALGLQVTDVKRDYVRTHVRLVGASDDDVEAVWADLELQGTEDLLAEGVAPDRIDLVRGADLRYEGEGYEVSVTLDRDALRVVLDGTRGRDLDAAVAAFHEEHERLYGFSYPGRQSVELVNLRVQAVGHTRRSGALPTLPPDRAPSLPHATRGVYWREHGWLECDIYDRAELAAQQRLSGPCVVEEYGATVVIPPRWAATVDVYGNLILARSDSK